MSIILMKMLMATLNPITVYFLRIVTEYILTFFRQVLKIATGQRKENEQNIVVKSSELRAY